LIGWLAKYLAFRPKLTLGFDVQGGLSSELASYGKLKNSLIRYAVYWIEKFIIARADLFFCSSKVVLDLLVNEFDVNNEKVSHVPDSSDLILDNAFNKLQASKNTAIYTGGLTESKGLGMLQEIIYEASRRALDIDFLIVGYPTDTIQKYIETNNIHNCTLTGRVKFEELANYMMRANVALEPKSAHTSEASGKLLNYMAAALPIVCFNTENNQNFLGENGYFAENDTASSFVDQLQLIIDHPDIAVERGQENLKAVTERFSWRSSAEKILNMYSKFLLTRH
jgi:glycosyltransferase involved in cell wall biosynthesis